MREQPSGKDLLDIARDVLRDDLIPALPENKRYPALMIANAMAIVMRQIETGEEGGIEEQKTLGDLLGEDGSLNDLNIILANRIREGHADGVETWQALRGVAVGKVAESNPRYLIPRDESPS